VSEPQPRSDWKRIVALSAFLGFVFASLCAVLDEVLRHVKQSFLTEFVFRAPHVSCPFWILTGYVPWYAVAALNVGLYGSIAFFCLKIRHARWFLLGLLSTCIIAITIYGFHLRRTATRILEDISTLRVGQSSFDDVSVIAGRYATRTTFEWTFPVAVPGLKQWPEKYECSRDACMFNFRVKNDKLAKIGVADPAEFSASVLVLRNRVVHVSAALVGGSNLIAAGGLEYTDEYRLYPGRGAYTFWSRPVAMHTVWVTIDNRATPSQRSHAFAINMKCLFRFGGCNDEVDYVPAALSDLRQGGGSQRAPAPDPR